MKSNRVLSGFFWKFSEQVSSQLVSFILSIILARLLLPKDYGLVALINIFITIANVFVVSGFGSALIQKKDANEIDFSTLFWLSELMSILVYLILYITAPLISDFYKNNELTLILRIFALQLPLSAFNGIQEAYIAKRLLFKKVFISTTIASILSGIIGIIMAFSHCGIWSLIGQYLSNTIIISIVLFSEIKWYPKFVFSWKSGKPLLDFGWKILVTQLLGTFFNQLRSLIIGRVYTATDLAYYNRGSQFPELISDNVNNSISNVLFPALSNLGKDHKRIKRGLRRAIRVSTFVLMPLLFGLMATSKQIILLFLGGKWSSAISFLQILSMSCIFDSVSNENIQALKAIGRSDILLLLEIIKKPIYLILLVFGMKINILAIAYTMVLYNVVAVLINMIPNRRFLSYSFKEQLQDIMPAFFNSFGMFLIVTAIGHMANRISFLMLIIQVIVGITSYILIAFLFRMVAFKYILGLLRKSKIKKSSNRI